jgi:hypothetical protein
MMTFSDGPKLVELGMDLRDSAGSTHSIVELRMRTDRGESGRSVGSRLIELKSQIPLLVPQLTQPAFDRPWVIPEFGYWCGGNYALAPLKRLAGKPTPL